MKLHENALGLSLAAVLLCLSSLSLGGEPQTLLPRTRAALMLAKPEATAILGLGTAGSRLVGVGERGVVLLSDDSGRSWRQTVVPVSVTLTSVQFLDAQHGFATGHGGTVLRTVNGGAHWTVVLDGKYAAARALLSAQAVEKRLGSEDAGVKRALASAQRLVDDGPDKPFLDLHFWDAQHGMVVGAYGLAFTTSDGGRSWNSMLDRLDNTRGLHLNAITAEGPHVVIAGEQGLVLCSQDRGLSFTRTDTPYRGSWFAAHVDAGGKVLLGGLRGNGYVSPARCADWSKMGLPDPVSITAFQRGPDGNIYAGNQAGSLYVSRDGGRSFAATALRGSPQSADFLFDGKGSVFAGLRGVQRVGDSLTSNKVARP